MNQIVNDSWAKSKIKDWFALFIIFFCASEHFFVKSLGYLVRLATFAVAKDFVIVVFLKWYDYVDTYFDSIAPTVLILHFLLNLKLLC